MDELELIQLSDGESMMNFRASIEGEGEGFYNHVFSTALLGVHWL